MHSWIELSETAVESCFWQSIRVVKTTPTDLDVLLWRFIKNNLSDHWIPAVCRPHEHQQYPKGHHTLCPRHCCCRSPHALLQWCLLEVWWLLECIVLWSNITILTALLINGQQATLTWSKDPAEKNSSKAPYDHFAEWACSVLFIAYMEFKLWLNDSAEASIVNCTCVASVQLRL